jgi:hypothetical protein
MIYYAFVQVPFFAAIQHAGAGDPTDGNIWRELDARLTLFLLRLDGAFGTVERDRLDIAIVATGKAGVLR